MYYLDANTINAESVLGEILLYIFIEQELDAPKIMSKIEINESNERNFGRDRKRSYGIF